MSVKVAESVYSAIVAASFVFVFVLGAISGYIAADSFGKSSD